MSSFADCCKIESLAWEKTRHFFERHARDGALVTTDKGGLSRALQMTVGDVLLNSQRTGDFVAIECKAESTWTGNLFIETWSNRPAMNRGWLDKLRSDVLAYFFLDVEVLFTMSLPELQRWAFGRSPGSGNLFRYREVMQSKNRQRNETWGRIVPVWDLLKDDRIGLRAFDLSGGGVVRLPDGFDPAARHGEIQPEIWEYGA